MTHFDSINISLFSVYIDIDTIMLTLLIVCVDIYLFILIPIFIYYANVQTLNVKYNMYKLYTK